MSELKIGTWKEYEQERPGNIVDLEKRLWAPWLAASEDSIHGRMDIFPEGQLCVYDDYQLHASLSLNRIQWDGDPESLPSWDAVAGDPTTYENTYISDGNTLTMMSMNVNPESQGLRLPARLVDAAKKMAGREGIENIIGSFRPSEYGKATLDAIRRHEVMPLFDNYATATDSEGLPLDAWLRSLSRNGMVPLKVDSDAMIVNISAAEFEQEVLQADWREVEVDGHMIIWCGQTGFFYKEADGSYTYKESNVWGKLLGAPDK